MLPELVIQKNTTQGPVFLGQTGLVRDVFVTFPCINWLTTSTHLEIVLASFG